MHYFPSGHWRNFATQTIKKRNEISNKVRNLLAQSRCVQMLHYVQHDNWIGGPRFSDKRRVKFSVAYLIVILSAAKNLSTCTDALQIDFVERCFFTSFRMTSKMTGVFYFDTPSCDYFMSFILDPAGPVC